MAMTKGENLRHDHEKITDNTSYVSKAKNLRPDKKIKCISSLEGLIFILQRAVHPH